MTKNEVAKRDWDFVYDGRGTIRKPEVVITYRATSELTLIDNKLFGYLLNRAWNKLENSVHRIPSKDATDYLNTQNSTVIESLKRLGQVNIEITGQGPDGAPRVAMMHFLSFDTSFSRDGILKYAFDPILLTYLKDPEIFAKLSLNDARHFRTVGGLRLYEIMMLRASRRHDKVWVVTVEDLMKVLCSGETKTRRWDNFKSRILFPAIKECNEIAPFSVMHHFSRTGRKHKVYQVELTAVPKMNMDFLAPIRGLPAKKTGRDDATADLWDGRTDVERGSRMVVSEETMRKAEQVLRESGSELDLEDVEKAWREAMVGRSVPDPDAGFLLWVSFRDGTRNDPELKDLDDDALGDFLSGQ